MSSPAPDQCGGVHICGKWLGVRGETDQRIISRMTKATLEGQRLRETFPRGEAAFEICTPVFGIDWMDHTCLLPSIPAHPSLSVLTPHMEN